MSPSCLQGFLGCCLVVFHLSPRCGLKIVFQLPSTIPICLPALVFQLPPSVFHLSPCCFPVVFQMLSPTCRLIVSGLSCKCGLPIVSQFVPDVLSRFSLSCLPLNPHNAQLSSRFSPPMISELLSTCFKLPPRRGLPIVFQLYPLALNLKPSPLLGCKALRMLFFTCLRLPVSPTLATGVRLSGFLLLQCLFPGFPWCVSRSG